MNSKGSLVGAALMAASLLWSNGADAGYFTYSDWAALPIGARAAYVSGAFDALVGVSDSPTDTYRQHYAKCIHDQHMGNRQLAENIFTYTATKPAIQARGVVAAMVNYLDAFCGAPPAK